MFEKMRHSKEDLKLTLVVVDGLDGIGKESFSDFLVQTVTDIRDKVIKKNNYKVSYNVNYPPIELNDKFGFDSNSLEILQELSSVVLDESFIVEKKSFPNYESETGKRIKDLLYSVQTDETVKELEMLFNKNIVDEMISYMNILKERASKGIRTLLICDRYITSNFMYMTSRRGRDVAIECVSPYATQIPYPDILIVGTPRESEMDEYFEILRSRGNLDSFESNKELLIRVAKVCENLTSYGSDNDLYKLFQLDPKDVDGAKCRLYRFGLKWWETLGEYNQWMLRLLYDIRYSLFLVGDKK